MFQIALLELSNTYETNIINELLINSLSIINHIITALSKIYLQNMLNFGKPKIYICLLKNILIEVKIYQAHENAIIQSLF